MITENRIRQIILQEIEKITDFENNAPNGWHTWAETDAANGLTPEEGKAQRMKGGTYFKSKGMPPKQSKGHPYYIPDANFRSWFSKLYKERKFKGSFNDFRNAFVNYDGSFKDFIETEAYNNYEDKGI